ncbi:hypothetical protein HPB48_010982 [Haemaphysalis longicornis]|uniref:Uncharacterized protein n=1 Tax=Haemaphysalis longicornis TaxID=44386 RepID=A0A9J6GEF8_HAELO|nr:hypothetical protein HPB48_010982 [Haemaphysalis longicornis]
MTATSGGHEETSGKRGPEGARLLGTSFENNEASMRTWLEYRRKLLATYGDSERKEKAELAKKNDLAANMLPLAQAGASAVVAASKTIKGYDSISMQVVCMDTTQHEDSPKGNDAPGQQQTATRSGHAPQGGVASKSSTHRSSKPQWRPKHTPHIGRDELIVILKPSTTLDLKATFASGQVGSTVRYLLRECGNVELSVWPVWEQNVIVCGLNSEPAAIRLLGDVTLKVDGCQLSFRGHAKDRGDVSKEVLTIDPNDTSGSLKPKLRYNNGEILSVRRLGSSNIAVVLFDGNFVPRQIYYNDQGITVRLYKKTTPACHCCDTVGHRADICPRPKPGRCDQCGSEVATTPEGPVEHKCTPRCLICGGDHLTGTSGSSGRPALVKNNTGSETVPRTQIFSAEDFPPLPNTHKQVSDWVRAASRPLSSISVSTTPTEVALQRQNAELRRLSEILANKIQELETRLTGLTESHTTAGTPEPMQKSKPSERDESASIASGVSSASRCSDCTLVQRVPQMEHRLTKLERTIQELPKKILEGIRAPLAELWQQELSQIILAVTDSVMDTVQDWVSPQPRYNRSRSQSPRSDSHRRKVVPRPATGS